MKSPAPDMAVTSAEAEIAYIQGDPEILWRYFCQAEKPSLDVVCNIAWSLLTSDERPSTDNWKLVFRKRRKERGRPSNRPKIINAAQAIATGQAMLAGQHLLAEPNIDSEARSALAAVFNPAGDSTWVLEFKRPKRGYPQSPLRTELEEAQLGIDALSIYERKPWKQVYYEIDAERRLVHGHASPTLIKRAVKKVRNARKLAAAASKLPKINTE
jgi:hypothetical protein